MQAEERQQARGKLQIFLGYAAGVGKTYAMLEAARQRKAQGVDVVVGYVETHGRAETDALLKGLEIVPRRQVEYRQTTVTEMDVDAVLARRPQLALVDEFAHTNAPGSRHPKRYHDVHELLEAGIDVYTTLNIQHLESLNDAVAQITGVVVRETLPDSVLDEAAEIKLVDLPPDELIQRLHDGKVYVPDTAAVAVERFFRKGNLTALREMALRRAAGRVDEQMLAYMQTRAIPGPWPAGERLLVCVSTSSARRAAGPVGAPAGGRARSRVVGPPRGDRGRQAGARGGAGAGRPYHASGRGPGRPGTDPPGPIGGRHRLGLRPCPQRHQDYRRQAAPVALAGMVAGHNRRSIDSQKRSDRRLRRQQ